MLVSGVATVGSLSTIMLLKRVTEFQLFLDYPPLPLNGYTLDQFLSVYGHLDQGSYVATLALIALQITFIASSTIFGYQFIKNRSSILLTVPTIVSGLTQLIENILAASYLVTKDVHYADLAVKLTPVRSGSGALGYALLALIGALTLVFGIGSIGRDKRQVIKEKKD
ncbi:hypothetical protein HK103_004771 [Boothiomyces macroporosus]|uniref:Uncharacterized protein n=1 Tax=Boothiomyces macroporosus TaxID=261099 RepID=A0AAD5UM27_9FUNG|nr:hypothetical protein HK103_004771 [Boothiomyces macroporosus]